MLTACQRGFFKVRWAISVSGGGEGASISYFSVFKQFQKIKITIF